AMSTCLLVGEPGRRPGRLHDTGLLEDLLRRLAIFDHVPHGVLSLDFRKRGLDDISRMILRNDQNTVDVSDDDIAWRHFDSIPKCEGATKIDNPTSYLLILRVGAIGEYRKSE